MTDRMSLALALLTACTAFGVAGEAFAQTAPAAAAPQPATIGEFKDWTAYSAAVKGGKVCYALATPKTGRKSASAAPTAYFFVSNRPQEGIVNEVSVTPGFALKANSEALIDVDDADFKMMARGDGAFMNSNEEQAALVKAMREGKRDLKIKLVSSRGRTQTQVYSLAGVAAAMDKINAECRPAPAKRQ